MKSWNLLKIVPVSPFFNEKYASRGFIVQYIEIPNKAAIMEKMKNFKKSLWHLLDIDKMKVWCELQPNRTTTGREKIAKVPKIPYLEFRYIAQ